MPPARRTFLAWKNLTHSWRRLALAMCGIGFAVLLMTMQVGFRNAMLDSTAAAIKYMNCDLVMTSAERYMLSVAAPFSRRRLFDLRSDPDVEAIYPLYIEVRASRLQNPQTKVSHPIRVFAFDPHQPVLLIPGVVENQEALLEPDTILFDVKSKSSFGQIDKRAVVALSNRPVQVVGGFVLGTDFANDGNVVTSDATLSKIFRKPARLSRIFRQSGMESAGLGMVDVGLIKLRPNAQPQNVKRRMEQDLPRDVVLMTKEELAEQERRFWQRSTPVGIIFGLGTAMGFLVGIIFCYQILYSDIADHLPEFATLKAMGYSNRYFVGVVLQEALLLAAFGFVPGMAVSGLLYWWLGAVTGLLLNLTVSRALLILMLTIAMCAASGALTVRKVLSADPAELF
jgi:putative ABC transport system permease protein